MILDSHVHIKEGPVNQKDMLAKFDSLGISGAVMLSIPPKSFKYTPFGETKSSNDERLENLMNWCSGNQNLFPFYWLDLNESDLIFQISNAVRAGVAGFKIICTKTYPFEEPAMEIFRIIAEQDKPILFHSGILWDGTPSGVYNRPLNFECLMEVPKLRFALAHVGWPWCDEALAVYGKISNTKLYRKDVSAEMFLDMTPGTPEIYRKDLAKKITGIGYDLENSLLFGTDCTANSYDTEWTEKWLKKDKKLFSKYGWEDEKLEKIRNKNLMKFLGF